MLCYAPTEIGCIVVDISAGFSFEETIAVFFRLEGEILSENCSRGRALKLEMSCVHSINETIATERTKPAIHVIVNYVSPHVP